MNVTSASRNTGDGLLQGLVVLAVVAHALAGSAQAPSSTQPSAINAHLVVDADPQCATATMLEARVRQRSQRIEFVDDAQGVARARVDMGAGAGSLQPRVVTLSMEWPDGRRAERRLTANSCGSALDAVALLLAMTLDPGTAADAGTTSAAASGDASGRDAREGGRGIQGKRRAAAAQTPTPAPASSADSTDGTDSADSAGGGSDGAADGEALPSSSAAAGVDAPTGEGGEPAVTGAPAPSASSAPSGGAHPLGVEHVVVGIHAALVLEVAPEAMPGVGVHALLALAGSGWWAPALELQLTHAWVDGVAQAGGSADFALDTAALGACPLGVAHRSLAARVCLDGTLGRVTAIGSDSYSPQSHERLWAALGATSLLSLGIGHAIVLRAGFGLAAPLSRYGFSFRPEVFHRVPTVHFHGHFGVGMRFP